jgi:hypothetical protein
MRSIVFPFRWRLALSNLGLVLLTIGLMLLTLYMSSRVQVTNAYRERLTATALGASIAVPADTVEALAASTARVSVPYLATRSALREFWRSDDGSDSSPKHADAGIFLVRQIAGKYTILVHSTWGPSRPDTLPVWNAPNGLSDSLLNLHAGNVHTYWFTDGKTLTAVAPILSSNSIPVGLIIARTSAESAISTVWSSLLALSWLPALSVILAFWIAGQLTTVVEAQTETAANLTAISHRLSAVASQLRGYLVRFEM